MDLFATLSWGQFFSILDLSNAYHQMEVDEPPQAGLAINTHKRLFRYLLLPYGVAAALSLFQKSMEQILKGIGGVVVYLDDLQVTGTTMEERLQRLDGVWKSSDCVSRGANANSPERRWNTWAMWWTRRASDHTRTK